MTNNVLVILTNHTPIAGECTYAKTLFKQTEMSHSPLRVHVAGYCSTQQPHWSKTGRGEGRRGGEGGGEGGGGRREGGRGGGGRGGRGRGRGRGGTKR